MDIECNRGMHARQKTEPACAKPQKDAYVLENFFAAHKACSTRAQLPADLWLTQIPPRDNRAVGKLLGSAVLNTSESACLLGVVNVETSHLVFPQT